MRHGLLFKRIGRSDEQLREPEWRIRRNLKSKRIVATRLRWTLCGERDCLKLQAFDLP